MTHNANYIVDNYGSLKLLIFIEDKQVVSPTLPAFTVLNTLTATRIWDAACTAA